MKKKKRSAPQLPYAVELQMKKQAEIQAKSEYAAQTALKLAVVALNDTEGLGFYRISRFASHLMELVDEYYADPELGECQLNRRLEQMGFVIGETGGVQAYAYPKKEQVARCGNAVPPAFATALARANYPEYCLQTPAQTMRELNEEWAV